MYCRNCGASMDPNAVVCVKCGVGVNNGTRYCQNCGVETNPVAEVCVKCGSKLAKAVSGEQKSKLVAGLLALFLGGFGIHNFYLGYTGKGIAQLCLSFCFYIGGIWAFIDAIMIFTGHINTDANGIPLKE